MPRRQQKLWTYEEETWKSLKHCMYFTSADIVGAYVHT